MSVSELDKLNKMKADEFDKMFDSICEEAAAQAAKELGDEIEEIENPEPFSEEHTRKMEKLFRRAKRQDMLRSVKKYTARAAGIVLVLIIAAGVINYETVDAWRIKFLNFVFESQDEENTNYNFNDDGEPGYFDNILEVAYIPEGFTQGERTDDETYVSFKNGQQYFGIAIKTAGEYQSMAAEEAEDIQINGNEGKYITAENAETVLWHDEKDTFRITGNLPREEMIKIAESVKKHV